MAIAANKAPLCAGVDSITVVLSSLIIKSPGAAPCGRLVLPLGPMRLHEQSRMELAGVDRNESKRVGATVRGRWKGYTEYRGMRPLRDGIAERGEPSA